MRLFKKWKKKRKQKHIPSKLIYKPLYQSLKSFNDDISGWIKISEIELTGIIKNYMQ